MSYGYGGRQNPFDQRDESPAPRAPPPGAFGQGPRSGGGGASRYNQPAIGRDEYGPASNVEMAPLAQNAGGFSRSGDPNAILNECRDIDQGIDEIERNLNSLRMLQDRSLNDADTSAGSATSRQLDSLSTETMAMYRGLTERVRAVKSDPESRQPKNTAQVGRVDRRLKTAIQQYQQVESAFRKKTQDQMARQYRIVRPDASEQEVRAAVEDTSQGAQVFQQALMQSDRRGQARAVLSAVQDRHAAIQKIEQQMIELAQLFQDMDTLVVQQEEQVQQIEQKGEEVVENLDKGNVELGGAVKSARGARRKKWICLGICVAILVIIAIVVAVYVVINNRNNGNGKRSLIEVRGIAWGGGEKPVTQVYAQSKIVVPGQDYDGSSDAPLAKFAGGAVPVRGLPQRRYVEWSPDDLLGDD
ncbi:Snare protein nsyn1 [Coniochaeta hoffmannii]|uniref:Snare protein nsyn1 n=1 Tax=Coniochaeta hoffmannii TaxID=91930 RepID=A0AA38RK43_9PEZI|nr:Snare protein nsyn1 [Coniochaeta hoffmannii]